MSDITLPLFTETISHALVDAEGSAFTLPAAKLGGPWGVLAALPGIHSSDPIEKL